MPYYLQKFKNGYKVYSMKNNKRHYYSNKPISYELAKKQMIALQINTKH